jgi:uncharacterized SAM-binding protein YcdF (DUF218 family)
MLARGAKGITALVSATIVAWLLLCMLVVEHPTINKLTHADAVVVLGPPEGDRIAEAASVVDRHLTSELVISGASRHYWQAYRLCTHPPADVKVTCFAPLPRTTRGEAEEVGRLAAQHHWQTVIVVTSKYHVSRARMLFGRCFSGRLEVVSSAGKLSAAHWAYQYLYQTGGYARAFAHRSC